MLIDKNRYKQSLAELWNTVFGDDFEYINLIFKPAYKNNILCFAELEDGKAVSAFYLIENVLLLDNKEYKGMYLYAAATLPDFRGRNIMSQLISEAQEYCRKNGYDFMSLVPSEDSLYSYYSRFGFKAAMYRYKNIVDISLQSAAERAEAAESLIFTLRNQIIKNAINFTQETFSYAFDCLKAADCGFYSLSGDSFAVYSEENNCVEEFISDIKNISKNSRILYDFLPQGKFEVYSPYELDFSDSYMIERSGMIYPFNPELEKDWNFTDIYMNIALD